MTDPAELVFAYSSRTIGASALGRRAAEHALQDQLVHAEVGLVQPEALDGGDLDRQARELVA